MVYYSALHWAKKAEKSAQDCENIKSTMVNVYKFKGSVATFSALPTNASVGDVYDVLEDDKNYGWTGSKWDSLGGKVDIDEALDQKIKAVNALPDNIEEGVWYGILE